MARLHTNWNVKQQVRGYRETGSVLAASMWKLSAECLLNLENEGFETISSQQRLDVICEFSAYLLHLLDRLVYQRLSEDERSKLICAVADKIAELIGNNRAELIGGGAYQQVTVNLLNLRGADYAECRFDPEEGPSFTLMRLLGEFVQKAMADKDSKWIPDYVIGNEAPRAYVSFKKAAEKMLNLNELK